LQQLGRDIAHQHTTFKGGFYGVKDSYHCSTGTNSTPTVQLGGPAAGP
jgi:hypothetical protein